MRTAEYVSPMHPDKICDRISDAILDACLEQDPKSRVAVETMGGHGIITVTGEITTSAFVDIPSIVHRIAGGKYGVQVNIVKQSQEIASGVDEGGAGDQGIVCGYACRDNDEMIPQEHYLARSLNRFIFSKYPVDGKTQVTIDDQNENKVECIVASFQGVQSHALNQVVQEWMRLHNIEDCSIYSNAAGEWDTGGFDADTGVTGRKIVVDAYGPHISVGGGAFSGKDATKIDRSGAYMARKIAVELLKENENLKEVSVKLAYVIGMPYPVMVSAIGISDKKEEIILKVPAYDLTPKGIIEILKLSEPQFEKIAEWGAFGNNFEWDQ